jgi:hypothetical protein
MAAFQLCRESMAAVRKWYWRVHNVEVGDCTKRTGPRARFHDQFRGYAMDIIFNKVCVLVTAAFALTLVPGFRQSERSLLSRRDQGTALLVFLVLGLRRSDGVTRRLAKRTNRGGLRGWSGSWSLGGVGRQCVCHLVGGCA